MATLGKARAVAARAHAWSTQAARQHNSRKAAVLSFRPSSTLQRSPGDSTLSSKSLLSLPSHFYLPVCKFRLLLRPPPARLLLHMTLPHLVMRSSYRCLRASLSSRIHRYDMSVCLGICDARRVGPAGAILAQAERGPSDCLLTLHATCNERVDNPNASHDTRAENAPEC